MPSSRKKKQKRYPWHKAVPVNDLGRATSFLELPVEIRFMVYNLVNDSLHRTSEKKPFSSWRPSGLILTHPTIAYEVLSHSARHSFSLSETHLDPKHLRNSILDQLMDKSFGKAAKAFMDPRTKWLPASVLDESAGQLSSGSTRPCSDTLLWLPQIKALKVTAPGLTSLKIKVTDSLVEIANETMKSKPESARDLQRWDQLQDKSFNYQTMHKKFKAGLKTQFQRSIDGRQGYGITYADIRSLLSALQDFNYQIESKVSVVVQEELGIERSADMMAKWILQSPSAQIDTRDEATTTLMPPIGNNTMSTAFVNKPKVPVKAKAAVKPTAPSKPAAPTRPATTTAQRVSAPAAAQKTKHFTTKQNMAQMQQLPHLAAQKKKHPTADHTSGQAQRVSALATMQTTKSSTNKKNVVDLTGDDVVVIDDD
ncbi:Hypothetical protein D9617_2g053650 [Elsinoe fawcettii]|nr:Hypothetical protein D9617_2g053650 [Elsinoe fawcettii]